MKIKKQKTQKNVIKIKRKFQDYKNCSEAAQVENKINHLQKNCLRKFVKNNKIILKTQQRFKIERHNTFNEEINKIALSSNDDKRMQSINWIETCIWNRQRSSM